MNVTGADKATGERLQRMRMDADMSQTDAVKAANSFARSSNRPEKFTIRSLRRWEKLGTPQHDARTHGSTPATLAELYILLRIYGGSPGYLMLGIEPARYPISDYARLKASITDEGMIGCINEVSAWPLERRRLFMEFFGEFIKTK